MNLIVSFVPICFDFLIAAFVNFCCLIRTSSFSDKDNIFNNVLIIIEINEEYKI